MTTLRRNIMLGTAGHVDHGKSALVKLLTGCETDTLAEEKQRGLTIDLGFAPCQLADKRVVGIVDVPGHVDFIRNMVAGAHGIDVVIFVVAADDGIMPQTHEHLHILTLMGLQHGIVALTKIDLVDLSRRDQVIQDLRGLLADTFLKNAPIRPVSTVTGEGFEAFFDSLNRVVAACGDRSCEGPFRLWVEDAFPIRGAGTVVTGIPTHGRVHPGTKLHLSSGALTGHVRRMQVYGEDAAEGRAGECVALNIPELSHGAAPRGVVLSESSSLAPCAMAEAELTILNSVRGKVEDYLEAQLHIGTAAVTANIAMLESGEMSGGDKQFVQLRLATPLPLVPGERFVVRANLKQASAHGLTTIGGGRILGLSNVRLRRQKPWTVELLAARCAAVAHPLLWCEQIVRESQQPVTIGRLQQHCWSRHDELAEMLESLRAKAQVVQVNGGGWLHRERIHDTAAKILALIEQFHLNNAQRAGMDRQELRAAMDVDSALLEAATESLLQAKNIERKGALLAKAGWMARLPDADQQLCDRLATKFHQAGWTPPALEELAGVFNVSVQRLLAMARLLAERGVLVRLDERIWMHHEAVEAAKKTALKLFRQAQSFSTMNFRDALGVSRKFAVPLADHLDKIRFTARSGNNRTPGAEAKRFLA